MERKPVNIGKGRGKKPDRLNYTGPVSDDTKMWYGTHKDKLVGNLPDSYLIYLKTVSTTPANLLAYIESNMEAMQANEARRTYNRDSDG